MLVTYQGVFILLVFAGHMLSSGLQNKKQCPQPVLVSVLGQPGVSVPGTGIRGFCRPQVPVCGAVGSLVPMTAFPEVNGELLPDLSHPEWHMEKEEPEGETESKHMGERENIPAGETGLWANLPASGPCLVT